MSDKDLLRFAVRLTVIALALLTLAIWLSACATLTPEEEQQRRWAAEDRASCYPSPVVPIKIRWNQSIYGLDYCHVEQRHYYCEEGSFMQVRRFSRLSRNVDVTCVISRGIL